MTLWERLSRWARKPIPSRPMGMTCREQVDLLVDYFDGTLDPRVAKALETHLADCPPCLNFLKTYKTTSVWVGELTCEEMPDELKARLSSFLKVKLRQETGGEVS